MRKAYLSRYAADQIHVRGKNKPSWHIFENRQENAEKLRHGEIMFFDENGKHVGDGFFGGPNPRKVVLERLEAQKLIQSTRLQRIEEFNRVTLIKTKKQELHLYFSGSDHFLMEMDHMRGRVRRSTVFKNKKKLLDAYSMNCLTWVESSPLARQDTP